MIDLHAHILPGLDDGPRTLDESAEMAAAAVAAEAARAGGEAVLAGPAIRGIGVQVDTSAARAAAASYLATADVPGSVTIAGGTRLQVTTSTSYTPVFLSMIGIGPLTTTGHAEVRLVRGLDGEA